MIELKNNERRPKRRLLQWIGTIITILALIFIVLQQGWGEIISAVSQISVWHLCGAIILIFASRLAVTMRWYVLVKAVEPQISFGSIIRVTFAGLFASNFLPSTIGGDAIRLAGAMQYSISAIVGAASLLLDRLIGMFGMFLMLPFAGNVTLNEIFKQLPSNPILACGFLGNLKLKELLNNLYIKVIDAFKTCSAWYKHPTSLMGAFLFTCLHMLNIFGSLWLLARGLGEFLPLWKLGALWSIVYFISLVPISINGYGLQEVSATFALTQWGGMSYSHSIIVALIIRVMLVLTSLPGALFLPKIITDLNKAKSTSS